MMQSLIVKAFAALMGNGNKDITFEPEPGAMAVSSPSLKPSYHVMFDKLKATTKDFNLRDFALASCQGLNRPEFILLLQGSLLVFCPSLGMAIIFQSQDIDEFDSDQQQDDQYQNIDDQYQSSDCMIQESTQCSQMQSQFSMTSQMQQEFMQQFVQFMQQLITRCSDAASQPQSMTKSTQSANININIQSNNTRSSEEKEEEKKNGGEEHGYEPYGEGRQSPVTVTTKVWQTVVIHF